MRCKITKANGENLQVYIPAQGDQAAVQPDVVAAVKNFLHSLFTQVDVYLDDKVISSSSGSYALRWKR